MYLMIIHRMILLASIVYNDVKEDIIVCVDSIGVNVSGCLDCVMALWVQLLAC